MIREQLGLTGTKYGCDITQCGACAEVFVSEAGVLKVHRIVAATDSGHAVNPQQILPRNIIQRFSCRYNGELVFGAELFSAVSANPYLAFHTVALETGTLALTWEGDNVFMHTENVSLIVTA